MQENLTVLVVDDDASVCDFVAILLQEEGYHAHCVGSAEQASAFLRKGEIPVALLLTDIELPGRNGIELMQECRDRDPSLPIVLMSGNPLRWLKEMKDVPFIMKPLSIYAFRKIIKAQIGKPHQGKKYETGTP
jgi:two-component system response regulator PilR (NtrC family)